MIKCVLKPDAQSNVRVKLVETLYILSSEFHHKFSLLLWLFALIRRLFIFPRVLHLITFACHWHYDNNRELEVSYTTFAHVDRFLSCCPSRTRDPFVCTEKISQIKLNILIYNLCIYIRYIYYYYIISKLISNLDIIETNLILQIGSIISNLLIRRNHI